MDPASHPVISLGKSLESSSSLHCFVFARGRLHRVLCFFIDTTPRKPHYIPSLTLHHTPATHFPMNMVLHFLLLIYLSPPLVHCLATAALSIISPIDSCIYLDLWSNYLFALSCTILYLTSDWLGPSLLYSIVIQHLLAMLPMTYIHLTCIILIHYPQLMMTSRPLPVKSSIILMYLRSGV